MAARGLPATAWIIGGSSGIGRAVARRLAQHGCRVVVSARSAPALGELAREFPGQIQALPLDVTDAEGVGHAVVQATEMLGEPPEFVLAAAGVFQTIEVDSFDRAAFAKTHAINCIGTMNVLAALMPGCIARGRGHIAVIASIAGYRGLPRASAYGSSKAAVINMCESLAPELAARGVRLRLVNPGFVDTPMTEGNDFPMPFLMPLDVAADRLIGALTRSSRFEITFPKRLSWTLKVLRILPYVLYLPLMRRVMRAPRPRG